MSQYDKKVIEYFLANQTQLLKEAVAETPEEAEKFLEDCMAVICKNIKEVRAYFEDEGADITGMSNEELADAEEVFALPDGRFLIVEA
ncbi:MAG: glyoxalase [Clostridiales bacterium]|nr:glyoxalase [Clostridiales bacterium]